MWSDLLLALRIRHCVHLVFVFFLGPYMLSTVKPNLHFLGCQRYLTLSYLYL